MCVFLSGAADVYECSFRTSIFKSLHQLYFGHFSVHCGLGRLYVRHDCIANSHGLAKFYADELFECSSARVITWWADSKIRNLLVNFLVWLIRYLNYSSWIRYLRKKLYVSRSILQDYESNQFSGRRYNALYFDRWHHQKSLLRIPIFALRICLRDSNYPKVHLN